MNETKKKIPLVLALCAATVLLTYRSILGLFTQLPSVFSGDVLGIIRYLAGIVPTLLPLALTVLLWMHQTKNQRRVVRPLCLAAAASYLVRVVLGLVSMARTGFDFYSSMMSLMTLIPMAISAYMFLWAAGCIKKWMVKRVGGLYFLFLYVGTVFLAIFLLVPMFMGIGVPFQGAALAYFPVVIAACLPTAIIDPEKAKPLTQTSAVVLVMIVSVLFVMSGQLSFGGSSGGSSSRGQTFEDYLWENDRDSYNAYQDLEKGWSSGSWNPETGFFGS